MKLFRLCAAAVAAIGLFAPDHARSQEPWVQLQDGAPYQPSVAERFPAPTSWDNVPVPNPWNDVPQAPLYGSFFEASGRIGSDVDLAQGDLFLTTLQTDYRLLYADIRGNWMEGEAYEGNFGMGYRCINPSECRIYGGYAFVDRMRSVNENYFTQATLGVEMRTVDWDLRLNGYIPQEDGKSVGSSQAVYSGGTIVVQTPEELAYYGTDIEAGYLIADSEDGSIELRGYATAFYFDRGNAGYDEIAGGRARLELTLFDLPLLGEGSRAMIGGQYQYDDVRGDIAGGLVSVQIPLCGCTRRPNRLQRRMLDPVVRDVNIVTNTGILTELALDAETGNPFGQLKLIDANTANVPTSVAAAGADALIIADGSAGQIDLSTSLTLQSGQTLRGAGFEVIGEQTGKHLTFGSEATFHGTNAGQDVVVLANDVTVRDVTITGGQNGIFGNAVSGIRIAGNDVSGAQLSGIGLSGAASGDIVSNSLSTNGVDGLTIDTYSSGTIDDNAMSGNSASGLTVNQLDGGTISENTASGNTNDGFAVVTMNGGEISDNEANGNGDDGFAVTTMNGGGILDNEASNNGDDGFAVQTFDGGTVSGNTATNNTGDGFRVDLMNFNVSNMPELSGNTATGNAVGFHFITMDGGDVDGNTATSNTGDGFLVETMSFGGLADNTSDDNGGNGYTFTTLTLGSITGNTADGNTGNGMFIGEITNGGVSNNTLTNNTLSGLAVQTFTNGQILGNTANGNTVDGFALTDFNFGLFHENSASSNGRDGFNIAAMNFGAHAEGNSASDNVRDGFHITSLDDGAEVVDNSASANGRDGFFVATMDSGAVFITALEGNTASDNIEDGFDIGSTSWAGGSVADNVSDDNTGFGFRVTNRTGGTASGNTASGNADNTLPTP